MHDQRNFNFNCLDFDFARFNYGVCVSIPRGGRFDGGEAGDGGVLRERDRRIGDSRDRRVDGGRDSGVEEEIDGGRGD